MAYPTPSFESRFPQWKPGETVTIPSEAIISLPQQAWWRLLPPASRAITIETASTAAAQLHVTGRFKQGWNLPGWGNAWSDQRISLTLQLNEADLPQITIDSISGTLTVGGETVIVQMRADGLGHHLLALPSASPIALQLLSGRHRLAPILALLPDLSAWLQIDYAVRLAATSQAMVLHHWQAKLPDIAIEGIALPLHDIALSLLQSYQGDADQADNYILATGQLRLDQDYSIRTSLNGSRAATVHVQAPEGKAFPGPAELLSALGYPAAAGHLHDALAQVPLLDTFQLTQLHLKLDLKQKKLLGFDVFGNFKLLHTHTVNFSLHYPFLSLQAALDAATPIPIPAGQLLTAWLGANPLVPTDIEVGGLSLLLSPHPFQFEFTLFLRNLWEFHVGRAPIALRTLRLSVRRDQQGAWSGTLAGQVLIAGIDFAFSADYGALGAGQADAWMLRGQAAVEAPIPLDNLLRDLGEQFHITMPESLPHMSLSDIIIRFNTGSKDFEIGATAQLEADLSGFPHGALADASLLIRGTHDASGQAALEMKVFADLIIGDHHLRISVGIGKATSHVEASWEDAAGGLALGDLIRQFHPAHADTHTAQTGVDLTLRALRFAYAQTGDARDLLLSGETSQGLSLHLVGQKRTDWKWLIAIEFDPSTHPSGVAGELLSGLHVQRAALLVSTGPFVDFTFPEMPGLGEDRPKQPLVAGHHPELDRGMHLIAEIDLRAGGGPAAATLPSGHLLFSATIQAQGEPPRFSAVLTTSFTGKFTLGAGTNRLTFESVVFSLTVPDPALRLHGEALLHLDHTPMRLKGDIVLDQAHVRAGLGVEFEQGGLQFFGVQGLYLDRLEALIGVTFAPAPGLELGLFGAMHLGDGPSGADAVGILVQLEGEVPVPELLELSIDQLDLQRMMAMFLGDRATPPDLHLVARFLHLYWSATTVTLPDGRTLRPGFAFNAELDVMGWKAYTTLTASTQYGLSGIAVCSPLHIGEVLRITGHSQGYRITEALENGAWVPLSNAALPETSPVTRERVVVPPGGPEIVLNTNQDPLLHIDLEVSIFHFVKERVAATLNKQKGTLRFELGYEAADIAGLVLAFELDEKEGFEATAACHFHLGGALDVHLGNWEIGKLNLSLGADATVSVGFTKAKGMWFHVDFSADLFGIAIGPLRLDLNLSAQDLATLPGKLVEALVANIGQHLADLWHLLFHRDRAVGENARIRAERQRQRIVDQNAAQAAAFEAHQRALAQQSRQLIAEAMREAAHIQDRYLQQLESDIAHAQACLQLGADQEAVLADRIAEIPLVDPHRAQRQAEIRAWQRQHRSPQVPAPSDRAAEILRHAAATVQRIQTQAHSTPTDTPHG
jgi:hypothetical protein